MTAHISTEPVRRAMPGAIALPAAPAIPGLVFRGFRGIHQDVPGMGAANQAARTAAGEIEPIDIDSMKAQYEHLERCDPATDLVVVELDGVIAGYARVEWDDTESGERFYDGVMLLAPSLADPRIRRALLAWSETRRLEIAASHLAAGSGLDRPWFLTDFQWDGNPAVADLLRTDGYEPFRRFHSMVRPDLEAIPEMPLPDGLEVRPITGEPALMRRIFEADVEAFRDHFGWVDDSDTAYDHFLTEPGNDLSLWQVAFDLDEVAGGVMPVLKTNVDGALEGWLDPVFTRRQWRRRGLARALIVRSLAVLRERGAVRSCLGVDSQNPNQAVALYESCGFRVASSSTGYRRRIQPDELAGIRREPVR